MKLVINNLVWSGGQVYDRLGQNDITFEIVLQEFAATYSLAEADEVFSSVSSEYDILRRVIRAMWCDVAVCWQHAACVCVACPFASVLHVLADLYGSCQWYWFTAKIFIEMHSLFCCRICAKICTEITNIHVYVPFRCRCSGEYYRAKFKNYLTVFGVPENAQSY